MLPSLLVAQCRVRILQCRFYDLLVDQLILNTHMKEEFITEHDRRITMLKWDIGIVAAGLGEVAT